MTAGNPWKLIFFFSIPLLIGNVFQALAAVGIMVLQGALNRFGSDVIAAYTAASKVEALVTQPFQALGITMATYCGQNIGAGKWNRVRKGMNACVLMCMVTVVAATAVLLIRYFTWSRRWPREEA